MNIQHLVSPHYKHLYLPCTWWLPGLSPQHCLLLCERSRPNTIDHNIKVQHWPPEFCNGLLAQVPTCRMPSPGALSPLPSPESCTFKSKPVFQVNNFSEQRRQGLFQQNPSFPTCESAPKLSRRCKINKGACETRHSLQGGIPTLKPRREYNSHMQRSTQAKKANDGVSLRRTPIPLQ